MPDRVGLVVDGKTLTSWKRVSVKRSLEAVAGKFELTISDRAAFPVRVGASVVLTVDDLPLVTGFVDRLQKSLSKREIRVEGRDRTGDLVDCSAVSPPFEFADEGLSAIAAKLCDPFQIEVVLAHDEGPVFPRFAIHPGETVFECIERAARLRGLLATTDGLGRLVLDRPSGVDVGVALVEGMNLMDASIDLDDSARFHDYLVLAHDLADGDPTEIEAPEGRASDEGARAGRILLVIAEGVIGNASTCQDRAAWEAANRASRAGRVTAIVQGAHATPEVLWGPGLLAAVKSPTLRVEAKMLVVDFSISQEKGGSGTRTDLTLARSDSFTLEVDKQRKRDPEALWDADVDEEAATGEE